MYTNLDKNGKRSPRNTTTNLIVRFDILIFEYTKAEYLLGLILSYAVSEKVPQCLLLDDSRSLAFVFLFRIGDYINSLTSRTLMTRFIVALTLLLSSNLSHAIQQDNVGISEKIGLLSEAICSIYLKDATKVAKSSKAAVIRHMKISKTSPLSK